MLTLILKPHIEHGGYHLDRFDAYVGSELIVTSRRPWFDGARVLLKRGHDPDTLLTIRHDGKDYDSFAARPIGELAKWTIKERDRGGLCRERFQSWAESSPVASASAKAA